MVKILGIDEAGRGPVIGPLVITGVILDEGRINVLIGDARDSKLLTKKKREELYKKYIKKVQYKTVIVEPKEIDEAVESDTLNLNWLEAHKSAEIFNELKPDKVILDCPSVNISAYTNYLRKLLNKNNVELIVEHKAEKYPIVAAASIIAKVTRDMKIDELKKKYGDFGSGYPSDPQTVRFLRSNWNKHPEIFRKSWESFKRMKTKKESLLSFIRKL